MRFFKIMALLGVILSLSACSGRFRSYDGPEVTEVRVFKADRRMDLMHFDTVLRSFVIDLGRTPLGHKTTEGDGRTPEGSYVINRRNPNSSYHLSIGISYPNEADYLQADARDVEPGGDIFIHGRGGMFRRLPPDWTEGCISVSDREIEDIYAMVHNGTPIEILP
jgi:murein L,D-transpeptidase YafK